MSFQQGLSGLNAAAKSLDVIGNNIANSSTVGFKNAQAQFSDVYANSLNGSGGSQVGIGVRVATVSQQFTQGNITSTSNPLDVAINGNGFFQISNGGAVSYSRNGQFQLDKNGYVVNSQGGQVTGYTVDASGALSTGSTVPININTSDIPPSQTQVAKAVINLDSRNLVPGTQIPVTNPPVIAPVAFSQSDPSSYNTSTSLSVFDSLGNSHILQTFYVKVDPTAAPLPVLPVTGEWDVFATVDGVLLNGPGAVPNSQGRLSFNNLGKLVSATPPFNAATSPNAFMVNIPVATGAVTPINGVIEVKLDFTGTTQFGSDFSVNALSQDGFTSGKLSKFSTAKDGTIVGNYTNGKTSILGQVILASFTNPNGLQSLGDNQWAETSTSGNALIGAPGNGGLGTLTSSAVEDSNTDLTAELVNLITAQRAYQANAQTIKTQDQVLQTLVNLR